MNRREAFRRFLVFAAASPLAAQNLAKEDLNTPINIHEFEAIAKRKLDPLAYDFIAGGVEDELTLSQGHAHHPGGLGRAPAARQRDLGPLSGSCRREGRSRGLHPKHKRRHRGGLSPLRCAIRLSAPPHRCFIFSPGIFELILKKASSGKSVGDGERQRAVAVRNRRNFLQVESKDLC